MQLAQFGAPATRQVSVNVAPDPAQVTSKWTWSEIASTILSVALVSLTAIVLFQVNDLKNSLAQ